MRKSYLLVYSSSVGSYSKVKETINSLDEITTWRHELNNTFFLVSTYSAHEISSAFRNSLNHSSGRFIISEITQNKQGWLTSDGWYVINKKKLKPKD